MSKRSLLFLSIFVSLAAHALVLMAAPRVPVLTPRARPVNAVRSFQVKLLEEPPPIEVPERIAESPLETRPSSFQDLMEPDMRELESQDPLLKDPVEVPNLAERVSSDPIQREHNLDLDPATSEQLDTKIIEISESRAREDIQVARRLVAPSPTRVLGKEEMPTFRRRPEEADRVVPLPSALPGPPLAQDTPGDVPEPEEKPEPEKVAKKTEPQQQIIEERRPDPIQTEVRKQLQQETSSEFIDDLVNIELDAYVPPGESEGFFRLRILPKQGQDIPVLPKDVTFVIDASKSILQRKLERTAEGIEQIVNNLKPEDRFNIVVFRDNPIEFRPDRVPATPENKQAAAKFLDGLESRGETDVYNAIQPVVTQTPRPGVPGIVVMISDGRPTTGVRDTRTLINALTELNAQRNSIFAFGGGNTVNRNMLDLLAYRNKGECQVTPHLEAINEELPKFLRLLDDPILVQLQADYGRVDEDTVFPKQIPDFYKGQAVTVYGRFEPGKDEEFVMRLTGRAGERKKEVVFKADLSEARTGDESIARNWAFRKIYHLIGETYRLGERPELVDERRRLSREYNIETIYDNE